jgi:hypothetical protein
VPKGVEESPVGENGSRKCDDVGCAQGRCVGNSSQNATIPINEERYGKGRPNENVKADYRQGRLGLPSSEDCVSDETGSGGANQVGCRDFHGGRLDRCQTVPDPA